MFLHTNKFVDQRGVLAKDQARNRQISISLENKFAKTRDALWSEHQRTVYPNVMQVSNTPSLQMLLSDEQQSYNQQDSLQIEALGRDNLATITDPNSVNYIIDRLTDEDIDNMNQGFPEIVQNIKTNYSKMNKDKFIDIVKSRQTYIPDFSITEKAQQRLDAVSQLARDQEAQYQEVLSNTPSRDSMISQKREEKHLFKKPEKGLGSKVFEEDDFDYEDLYPERFITPQKGLTPKKLKSAYGSLLKKGAVEASNEDEKSVLLDITRKIDNMKKKTLIEYIRNLDTDKRAVPASLNVPDLKMVAIRMTFEKQTGSTGSGLRKRMILGRGSPQTSESESDSDDEGEKRMFLDGHKFVINMEKLRKNILNITYASTRASIPSLKREHISDDAKNVILDILHNKYNENLFNKLTNADDQRLISTFVRLMKIKGISMTEFDKAYQLHFQVLQGEINAGNSNPKIRQEYKQYVLRGISESLIPRAQGLNMLLAMHI